MNRFLLPIVLAVVLVCAGPAYAALFAAQPDSGKLVEIDPVTGAIRRGFAAPDPSFNLVGLSGGEGGNVLIWRDGTGSVSADRITRINPISGAVIDYHTPLTYSGILRGLTAQNVGGAQYLVVGGQGDPPLVQHGYDSNQSHTPSLGASAVRALGGDDRGRSFASSFDETIREFDPVKNTILNTFSSAPGVTGLAFDGQYLYAAANEVQGSNIVSRIYTLDPDTGAVVRSALLLGSPVTELGVAIPEPSCAMILLAACGLVCRLRLSAGASRSRTERTSAT